MNTTHYILIKPWGIYVKEAVFFMKQGGLTQKWGQGWIPVEAQSIEHARELGHILKTDQEHSGGVPHEKSR